MIFFEVNPMENEQNIPSPEEGYIPRPKGQVWAARIGLVLFIGLVIFSYILLANGALL
jgi:hypothetical protein